MTRRRFAQRPPRYSLVPSPAAVLSVIFPENQSGAAEAYVKRIRQYEPFVASGSHLPLVPALIVIAVVVGLKVVLARRKRR